MRVFGLKNIVALIFIFSALLLISGCNSKKTIASGGVLLEKTKKEVFTDALHSEVEYQTISAKGSIGYGINGSGKKVSAVFKIKKDKMLQVSVRFLGIEGARVTVTPDSIFAINRLKKQYVAESISSFKDMIDFNYYNLQSLLTNKIFLPGKQAVDSADFNMFKMTAATEAYILQAKGQRGLSYNFDIDASNHIIKTHVSNEGDEAGAIEWTYSDFIKDTENNYTYPTSMSAKMVLDEKLLNLDISFSKLNINEKGFDINNTISSGYTKKTIKEFISALP